MPHLTRSVSAHPPCRPDILQRQQKRAVHTWTLLFLLHWTYQIHYWSVPSGALRFFGRTTEIQTIFYNQVFLSWSDKRRSFRHCHAHCVSPRRPLTWNVQKVLPPLLHSSDGNLSLTVLPVPWCQADPLFRLSYSSIWDSVSDRLTYPCHSSAYSFSAPTDSTHWSFPGSCGSQYWPEYLRIIPGLRLWSGFQAHWCLHQDVSADLQTLPSSPDILLWYQAALGYNHLFFHCPVVLQEIPFVLLP